jgi:hypothetical protein
VPRALGYANPAKMSYFLSIAKFPTGNKRKVGFGRIFSLLSGAVFYTVALLPKSSK